MGKQCDKCLRKYEDTRDVCLFCGDRLKREEECRKTCSIEGTTPEAAAYTSRVFRRAVYAAAFALLVAAIVGVTYFTGGQIWANLVERLMMAAGK